MSLTIAHLSSPAWGEVACGDAVVIRRDGGTTMFAVIDVLGHGPAAATVAKQASEYLSKVQVGDAEGLMLGLHQELRGTRGAAASICIVRGDRLDTCGVGNVEIRVVGSSFAVLLTPGIVGQNLFRLRSYSGALVRGDRIVLFSDGISSRAPLGEIRDLSPRDACTVLLQRHRRAHDDASVVIADLAAME